MGKQKYYVVWHGVTPGVYASWDECLQQVKNFAGAIYKSFNTEEEAKEAYYSSPFDYVKKPNRQQTTDNGQQTFDEVQDVPSYRTDTVLPLPMEVTAEALAVDAACSGNPGPMEYRGIYLKTGQEVFHFGPVHGTNNIGEFLAIVHALALLKQKNLQMTIYSDSRNAIAWVRQKKCKTQLERNATTEELFKIIERAENWLKTHTYSTPILKWETERWGEVPADFGRK